ncbi:MAG: glycosyltransferase family 2 protein [Bacteroidota bacterium]|nr:glycosyltransferase family 2 protein [Bacteroidota bacterium]
MRITLITATFNSASSIKTCLDSVVLQNYNDLEYLIIDGKSSDATLKIIKVYQKKFPFIKLISEKDFGIYDALNKGVQLASGDVIGFVHSDDFLEFNDIINDIVSMTKSENLDGVYGDLQYVDKSNTQEIIRSWKSCDFKPRLLKQGWMPPHPTLFLKRDVYEKHGLFDLSYRISADYDFLLRIFKDPELKFGYLPKVITKMRVGGVSNQSLKNIIKKSKEDYRAIRINNIGNFLTLVRKNFTKIKQLF